MFTGFQRNAFLLISFLLPAVAFAAQPQPLRIAVANAPKTLDAAIATDAAAARLLQLTHPALLGWGPGYRPVGLVAQACGAENLRSVTCTLRPNARFTDGAPLTAPAVAAWFTQLQGNPRSPFSGQLKGVGITAPTSTTLHFALPSPTLGFVGMLTEVPIANPASPAAGMGPYHVEAQDTLGNTTLATTQPGLPARLSFMALADPTTRLLKLKKGEVDMVLNDLPPQLVQWAQKQGYGVVAVAGTSYTYLTFNFRNPYLARSGVREAVALALNRPAIRKFLLGDMAQPASSILPPGHPAAWAAPEEVFDPFTAESTLDDENLLRGPDNMRFTVTLLVSTDAFVQRLAQVIQAQLQGVGINVQLRPVEWAGFYDSVKKGDYDLALLTWTGEQRPDFYYHLFNASQVPPLGFNRGRVDVPQVNRLTLAIRDAPTEAAQNTLAIQLQQTLANVRPYIPLYRRAHTLVTRPGLTGCALPPSGAYTGLLTCRSP
ncbi:MAG: ABC transporter substrate-binding protein [Phycisphaerales bacterium]|jgi:peptide/nickel transport system substrate-binding protein